MRAIVASLVIAGSLAASAMPAHAQRVSGWAAYLGCWAPGEPDRSELAAPTPAVMRCIVPGSADDRVLMLTVQRGNVLDRQEVVADGAERAVDRDGCRGTERATWTGGGARLLVRGELACAAGASGSTTAILDVVSGSAWLQVAGIRSGNNVDARPQWYRRVQPDSTWPASVITALTNTGKATQIARVAAVSDPDLSEIERLATTADEAVVRAWLVSREAAGRRPIPIDGKALVRLARAGVGGVVTDVLVALANPDAFELSDGGARPTTAGATNFASNDRRHRRMGYSWMNDPMCDGPWNASSWLFYNPMYGGSFPSTRGKRRYRGGGPIVAKVVQENFPRSLRLRHDIKVLRGAVFCHLRTHNVRKILGVRPAHGLLATFQRRNDMQALSPRGLAERNEAELLQAIANFSSRLDYSCKKYVRSRI